MTLLTIDHEEKALSRVTDDLNKEDFNKLVSLFTSEVQQIEDAVLILAGQKDLDTVTGIWLDYIGKLIGLDRGGLLDEAYRAAIKLQIAINNSDGTPNKMISLVKQFTESSSVRLREGSIAWGTLYFNGQVNIDETLYNMVQNIKPVATRWILESDINNNALDIAWEDTQETTNFVLINAECGDYEVDCGELVAECGDQQIVAVTTVVGTYYPPSVNSKNSMAWEDTQEFHYPGCGEDFMQCGNLEATCNNFTVVTTTDVVRPLRWEIWPGSISPTIGITMLLHQFDGTNGAAPNTIDQTGLRTMSILTNTVVLNTTTKYSGSASMVGDTDGNIDQYQTDTSLDLKLGDGIEWTIEGFFRIESNRTDSSTPFFEILGTDGVNSSSIALLLKELTPTTFKIQMTNSTTGAGSEADTTSLSYADNTWYHISLVGDASEVRLYLNSNLLITQTSFVTAAIETPMKMVWVTGYTDYQIFYDSWRFVRDKVLYTGSSYSIPAAPLGLVEGIQYVDVTSDTYWSGSTPPYTWSGTYWSSTHKQAVYGSLNEVSSLFAGMRPEKLRLNITYLGGLSSCTINIGLLQDSGGVLVNTTSAFNSGETRQIDYTLGTQTLDINQLYTFIVENDPSPLYRINSILFIGGNI